MKFIISGLTRCVTTKLILLTRSEGSQLYVISWTLSSVYCASFGDDTSLILLKRLKPFVNRNMATTVYNSLIQSALDYCDVVWSTCRASSASSLQRLQFRAAKTFLNLPTRSPSAATLTHLSLGPILSSAGPTHYYLPCC